MQRNLGDEGGRSRNMCAIMHMSGAGTKVHLKWTLTAAAKRPRVVSYAQGPPGSPITRTSTVAGETRFAAEATSARPRSCGRRSPRPALATDAAIARSREWLDRTAGAPNADALRAAILRRYGKDLWTFSVPILTVLALAGKIGSGDSTAWAIPPPTAVRARGAAAWLVSASVAAGRGTDGGHVGQPGVHAVPGSEPSVARLAWRRGAAREQLSDRRRAPYRPGQSPSVNPSFEAVAASTSVHTYDAEIGLTGGGTYNVSARSGAASTGRRIIPIAPERGGRPASSWEPRDHRRQMASSTTAAAGSAGRSCRTGRFSGTRWRGTSRWTRVAARSGADGAGTRGRLRRASTPQANPWSSTIRFRADRRRRRTCGSRSVPGNIIPAGRINAVARISSPTIRRHT